jgi:UDP-3-O-[3-hydroxymyristoyl] glucosamine N-acyltransferase
MNASEIAAIVEGQVSGDGAKEVTGVASLAAAGANDLSFVEDAKFVQAASGSKAGVVIVGEFDVAALNAATLIVAKNPRLAFAKAGSVLARASKRPGGIHPTATIDASAKLAPNVSVGAYAVIGPNVSIGHDTIIGPGCILMGEIDIGEQCEFVARVTVYPKTKIGNRAIIHAGAVLGSDGFGFVPDVQGRFHKFPQIGALEIGDDVEIGANSTVDRGALDATIVGNGVKLDNLVHVGHNAKLGDNVVAAAQTGISGSSVVEKNVLIGGQVGIADHVTIEEGAILGAQAGIPSNKTIRGKGVVFWGTPARPIREYLKELAAISRLAKKK